MNTLSQLKQLVLFQQKKLIAKDPKIKNFFIDIWLDEFSCTLPFLLIRCFRDFDIHVPTKANNENEIIHQFYSSGSTGYKKASHKFTEFALNQYEVNTCNGFTRFLEHHNLPKFTPIVSLVPKISVWQNSSLAAMIDMFSRNDFNVHYCDIEDYFSTLKNLKTKFNNSEILIFGTTFHHLNIMKTFNLPEHQEFFNSTQISIIDTGGTKGRTEALSLEEFQSLTKSFYTHPNFKFFSEYGMCELSSQAWSLTGMHDGTFFCNESTYPFILDLNNKSTAKDCEKGFLAFIDTLNTESYCAIITEDLAQKVLLTHSNVPGKTFKLIGRAPDATLKGCSLNVRPFFEFSDKNSVNKVLSTSHSSKFSLDTLLSKIDSNFWNQFSKSDLYESLKSLDHLDINKLYSDLSQLPESITIPKLTHKNVLIITSANSPIAWVYPFIVACLNRAQKITVKAPSLRLDDPFCGTVRDQIFDLFKVLSSFFTQTQFYIDSDRALAKNFTQYDFVVLFGSADTVSTFTNVLNESQSCKTELICLGDVKNGFIVDRTKQTTRQLSQLCQEWNARGCLSPVALFVESENLNWLEDFKSQFCSSMNLRYQGLEQHFFHAHNKLFMESMIKWVTSNPTQCIYKSGSCCIVDLTSLSLESINRLDIDFSLSGCGFIFIFKNEVLDLFKDKLSFYDVNPTLTGAHMGKTWAQHFSQG